MGSNTVSLVNLDIRVKDGVSLKDAVGPYGADVSLSEFTSDSADGDPGVFGDLIAAVQSADLVVVRLTGNFSLFSRWEEVRSETEARGKPVLVVHNTPSVSMQYRDMSKLEEDDHALALRYLTLGGPVNQRVFVAWALNRYGGASFELPEPVVPPA